ncbi:MAG TPA: TetR family transcriptional regulator [Bryobacteraceae bacterium]|nr:TetR family transcriptional regulator [Bryobacteraceae bacterium]
MPTTRPRRKDLPENRRACILQAARCVFAKQGYADTVVEDIATRAGIAKGTLYLYFDSKEEIFLAALREDARSMEERTRERMEQAGTWQDKLKAYVDVRLEYLETHQDFIRIYLAEFRSMMLCRVRVSSDLFNCVRESEGQLAQVFAAAIARDEIRTVDADLAARTLSDLTRGLMERRLLGWSARGDASEASFAVDLLCRALERD